MDMYNSKTGMTRFVSETISLLRQRKMKFQIIALLLSTFTFALPIQQFVDVEELIPQFRLIIEEVLKKDKPTLAEQILKYNGDFAVKFGVRGDMTDDQVAKQLDRAVLRTRIGNGMVGGLVGAGDLLFNLN
jgi:hypothetical protein